MSVYLAKLFIIACLGLLPLVGGCQATVPTRPAPPSVTPQAQTPQIHGQLKKVDGLDVLWLWGTREQIGYAEGALLCGRIPRFFAAYYLNYLIPLLGKSYEELSGQLLPLYQVPGGDERELRAILRGMREQCPAQDLMVESPQLEPSANGRRELRYEDLVFSNVAYEMFLGCSSFTVWGNASASGATLHARNVDFLLDPGATYTREQILKVYSEAEQGNQRWASLSWPGALICHSCFAPNGLGMTVNGTNVLPAPETATGKMPMASAYRAALVTAIGNKNQAAAVATRLQESPLRGGANLNVFWPCHGADCTGGLVLEHDGDASHPDGRVTLRRPGEADDLLATRDAIITTNHYLKRVSSPPNNRDSLDRYRTLREGIDEYARTGGVDVAKARQLMSAVAARSNPLTVITVIFDTATQRLNVYRTVTAGQAATDSEPSVISLAELFAAFPDWAH